MTDDLAMKTILCMHLAFLNLYIEAPGPLHNK